MVTTVRRTKLYASTGNEKKRGATALATPLGVIEFERVFLVAVTLGLVLTLGLIRARGRIAVFVFLYLGVFAGVLGRNLLSLGSVFGRIFVLGLYTGARR